MIAVLVALLLVTPIPKGPDAPHVVAVDAAEIPYAAMEKDAMERDAAGKGAVARADDPRCGPAATAPVPDGQPIRVVMPPAKVFTVGAIPAAMWRRPPVADPTWRLNFQ